MEKEETQIVDRAMREDFLTFASRCFLQVNPGAKLTLGWHVEVMAEWMALMKDAGQRMIVNVPPRHLKSMLGSIALPAWLLGHNPSMQIICVSYAAELANKLSRDCRAVMESDWYRRAFPKTVLDRFAVHELTTTRGGARLATSVGGVLTGRGADLIIIDDPIKPDEALSEAARVKVNDWYDNTLYSRLNNKERGNILVIMQRLHEDDLTGHLTQRDEWDHLVLKAIAEEPFVQDTTLQYRTIRINRKVGDALHPERESIETLEEIRRTIGEYNFASQYQQSPAPAGGGLVKRAWFRSYRPADLPAKFDTVLQSWDTANKPTELADYSVCTTWGRAKNRFYLLHVLRKKLDYPSLKRAVREQAELHKATTVLIEDKASGTQLIQELSQGSMPGVKRYTPEPGMNKLMRMNAQTGVIENGLVFLPEAAEWLDTYLHELTTFPASKHDDQVDSTSQALHWFVKDGRKPGILLYYQQLEEERLQKEAEIAANMAGMNTFDASAWQVQQT